MRNCNATITAIIEPKSSKKYTTSSLDKFTSTFKKRISVNIIMELLEIIG